MRILKVMGTFAIAAMVFLSCRTAGASVNQAAAAVPAPVKEKKTVEIRTWKPETVTVAYPDGIISGVTETRYNNSGQIINEEQYDGKKNLVSKKTYSWEGEKNVAVISTDATGEIIGKNQIEYDGARPVKETLSDPKGIVQSTELYRYDASGNRTGHSVQTSTGSLVTTEYTLTDGKIAGVRILDAAGMALKRYERAYNADGSIARETEYGPDGVMKGSVAYTYQGKFLVREEVLGASGIVQSKIEYTNDAEGNPVDTKYYDRSGRLTEVRTAKWKLFSRTITVE